MGGERGWGEVGNGMEWGKEGRERAGRGHLLVLAYTP